MLIQAALTCVSWEIEIIFFNFLSITAVKIFGEEVKIPSKHGYRRNLNIDITKLAIMMNKA
uniref:Uncharacterized protein n=1 Tax=Onchocerca volvulus TaxID=6282 RepID=A0A8R1XUZ1_ONCVO